MQTTHSIPHQSEAQAGVHGDNAHATAGAELPTSGFPLPASTAGRPTHFTESTIHTLCSIIREHGMSESAAAAVIGIAPSTLSRWKSTHPGLAEQLAASRELFRIDQINLIRHACTRDGRHDWRAAAWLLERIFPEDYARRRPTPPTESHRVTETIPGPPEIPPARHTSASPAETRAAQSEPTSPSSSSSSSPSTPTETHAGLRPTPLASARLGASNPSSEPTPQITLASVFQNSRTPSRTPIPLTGAIIPEKVILSRNS